MYHGVYVELEVIGGIDGISFLVMTWTGGDAIVETY